LSTAVLPRVLTPVELNQWEHWRRRRGCCCFF